MASFLASCSSFSMEKHTFIVDPQAEPGITILRMEEEKNKVLEKHKFLRMHLSYEVLKADFLNALSKLTVKTPIPIVFEQLENKAFQEQGNISENEDLKKLLNFILIATMCEGENICMGCDEVVKEISINEIWPNFKNISFPKDTRLKLCSNCRDFIYSFDRDLVGHFMTGISLDISKIGLETFPCAGEYASVVKAAKRFAVAVFVADLVENNAEQVGINMGNENTIAISNWQIAKLTAASVLIFWVLPSVLQLNKGI